ncbi:hypothetical protein BH20ACT2_BH20ACT2_09410 [soil metagenome]
MRSLQTLIRPSSRPPARHRHRWPRVRTTRGVLAFWLAAILLAATTGLVVHGAVDRAEAARARYGELRTVAVATEPLSIGDEVSAGAVELRRLPAALLPEATFDEIPAGRTVVAAVGSDEPLVEHRLAPGGLSDVAALLPTGTRAVALVDGAGGLRLAVGDHVDVLATFDPLAAEGGDPSFPVAEQALVVDVSDEAVTVAVTPDEAARVAFGLAQGRVTLLLTAGPGS